MSTPAIQTEIVTHFKIGVYQDVLIFDIAVCYPQGVQVRNGVDDLRKDVPRLGFRETFVWRLFNAFKQIVGWSTCVLRSQRFQEHVLINLDAFLRRALMEHRVFRLERIIV